MNVILFTGQSGIRVKECLERLSQHVDLRPKILSIERKMEEISGRPFLEILLEKLPYQYELWRKAFDKILADFDKSDEMIFLTLHGVYYHQDKREFISPVNPESITKLRKKVKMLIVFIDDIYDIYRRLLSKGGMYSDVMNLNPLEAVYASIFHLISILEWRQIEITISRLIARILNIPMYIVATKHPSSMIAKLINIPTENLQIYYLSHPISSVRKNAVEQLSNFVGELNSFAKTVMNLQNTILFLPGTIDELRIKNENNIYLPEFLPRWPLPFDRGSWIFPPLPEALRNINPLNPLNFNIASSSEVKVSVSYLIKLLWDYINVQITSRDLSLVEQSKNGVIAYRPYFPYKLSGGARRELEYNYDLYEKYEKERSRRSIIFSVLRDKGKARIQKFFTLIETLVKEIDDTKKQKLQDLRDQWIYQPEMINLFLNDTSLKKNLITLKNKIEIILPSDYIFQLDSSYGASLSRGRMGEKERNRYAGFHHIIDRLVKDPLNDYLISKEDYIEVGLPDEIDGTCISKILETKINKRR